MSPEQAYQSQLAYHQQPYGFQNFANPRNTPPQYFPQPQHFPSQSSQPQYFSQQPSQPQAKDHRDGRRKLKKTGKQPVVDLDEDDDDDMAARRAITHWNHTEEILLAETWIEHSQDVNIEKDQQDDVYWNLIMQDFNARTKAPPRTKNMMTGKWTRMHGDCQRINYDIFVNGQWFFCVGGPRTFKITSGGEEEALASRL
nr:glutathione S-transferase T3-like [Tanacetum cinerariifolium]